MRDAGSSYAWIRAAFGPEGGAYGAWVLLVANVFAVLATALPAGTYTLDLLAPALAANALAVALVACGWIVATALLLWYGLRPTAMLALAAARRRDRRARRRRGGVGGPPAAGRGRVHRRAARVGRVVSAIVLGIWLIDGWEVSASTAEEAQGDAVRPGRRRPRRAWA